MFNAFFKKWAIPGLFLIHFRLFNTIYYIQLIENKIADDWIRTADLWCRKRPLYQPLPPVLLRFISGIKHKQLQKKESTSLSSP